MLCRNSNIALQSIFSFIMYDDTHIEASKVSNFMKLASGSS